MATQSLTKRGNRIPSAFDDFFKPWNEWFGNNDGLFGQTFSVPAVNITEEKGAYQVWVAAPGMKKEDFRIGVEGNLLTISSEKEESTEEKDKKYSRKEYNYTSFSRNFSLPDEVNSEKIEATYQEGVLKIILPRREEAKKNVTKQIAVQ
jgi:HSP20 family protein